MPDNGHILQYNMYKMEKRDKCPQGLNNYIFREEQESSLKIHRTNLFKFELSVAQMITQLYL